MELYQNREIPFTRWIVPNGFLRERMAIVDVGCRGGLLQNWDVLGDLLDLHSFDPAPDAVEALRLRDVGRPNRHHYVMAIGDEDGSRAFFVKRDRFGSSLYRSGDDDLELMVPIRPLDALHREGILSRADFIKIDVESHESAVLRGARMLMRSSPTIGLEIETNFNISPNFRATHFAAINEILVEEGFLVADLNFDRFPRPSFAVEAARLGVAGHRVSSFGRSPVTFNFLFCRDFCGESDFPHHYLTAPPPLAGIEKLVKMLIVFEMYGCLDRAVDLLARFREIFAARFDCDRAAKFLVDQDLKK